jgi:hypothetical protein
MRKIVLKKAGLLILFAIIFVSYFNGKIYASVRKPYLIKRGIPTHYEKDYKFLLLKLVHTIPMEFSKKYFFARPMELVVNENGNIFVYDDLLNKILKFKSDFKFNSAFGQTGQGPGDFSPSRKPKFLGVFKNKLIVSDFIQKKITIFKENGTFIKEIRFPTNITYALPIITFRTISLKDIVYLNPTKREIKYLDKKKYHVTDQENYIISGVSKKGVNYIGKCNKSFDIVRTFFSENAYYPVIEHLSGNHPKSLTTPDSLNTTVHIIPRDQTVVIYIANSSSVFVFYPDSTSDMFRVIPNMQLKFHKKYVQRLKKKLKSDDFFIPFFYGFFLDQDNWKFIYFTGSSKYGNDKKHLLYKFDLEGNLINIFYHYFKNKVDFMAKKNGYFFSIDRVNNNIRIFKEEI